MISSSTTGFHYKTNFIYALRPRMKVKHIKSSNATPSIHNIKLHPPTSSSIINTTVTQYPTIDLSPQSSIFLYSDTPATQQCYHLSTDVFNPHFTAILHSQLTTTTDTFPVILDTGCSFAMTHDPNDFLVPPVYSNWGSVQTANDSMSLTAFGTIHWQVQTTNGTDFILTVPGFLVPGSNVRLMSPQDYVRYHQLPDNTDQYGGTAYDFWMHLQDNSGMVQAAILEGGRLPILFARQVSTPDCKCHSTTAPSCLLNTNVFADENQNLTSVQKLLMLDHCRLGHLNFQHLQLLYKQKQNINTDISKQGEQLSSKSCLDPKSPGMINCAIPLCQACLLSKAKKRPMPGKSITIDDTVTGSLKREDLMPGDRISLDHYQSSVRGRLENTKGCEKAHEQYIGGTIFVDHASGVILTCHQPTLGTSDTLRSLGIVEHFFTDHNVKIRNIHSDNGTFTSTEFKQYILQNDYHLTLSGVGAKHQNGIAERAIQTVVWKARSMMIHLQIHWPDHFQANLWPFALSYATWIHNHTPTRDLGFAPLELFTGTLLHCHALRRLRVFGSPAYVLDPKLQDGFKIPKWEPRARLGQFLGFSASHSSTIGMIRNLRTNFVSPQYHVVYNEKFTSVSNESTLQTDDFWMDLFLHHRDHYLDDTNTDLSTLPQLHSDWTTSHSNPSTTSSVPPPDDPPDVSDTTQRQLFPPLSPQQGEPFNLSPNEGENVIIDIISDPLVNKFQPSPTSSPEFHPAEFDDLTQPTMPRARKPNPKYFGDQWINIGSCAGYKTDIKFGNMSPEATFLSNMDLFNYNTPIESKYTSLLHHFNPQTNEDVHGEMGFFTQISNSDYPTLHEIQNMEDREEQSKWYEAMDDEINSLLEKQTFTRIDRSFAVNNKLEIVGTTWVFRRKRKPDGTITKLKARLVVRGDQQKTVGRTVDETYAPVIEWATVRLLLTLAVTQNLCTSQIDFKNAFVQSSLPAPIYVELPPGGYRNHSENQGKILEVHKSLYGDRRAPKLWYMFLRSKLELIGFHVDKNDPCLFTKDWCIFVTYVDDGIFVAENQTVIEENLKLLQEQHLDFEEMGSLLDYLGVHVEPSQTTPNSIELVQPDLINRIIEVMGLKHAKSVSTPAESALGICENDDPASGEFNYRSVVGMAMFLCNNTRLDCAMAVHQCARFSSNPKRTHEVALKRLGRYLVGTANRGLIIRPSKDFALNCYVDADFAGVFNLEDACDPRSVLSRTGFIITLGDVPVYWKSKLQPQIALSTMEAEYIALSTSLRSLLPMKETLHTMAHALHILLDIKSEISTVWEDNHATQILATTNPPRLTPRSKHIGIRYHWFRDELKPGKLVVKAIKSDDQKADILTKALQKQKHEAMRQLSMGW